MRARTPIIVIATALLGVATATACRHESPAPPTASTPDLATPSPPALPTPQALAAYRAMWDSVTSAARTADSDAPALRHYATGPALARIVTALYLHHEQGEVVLGTLSLAPTADLDQSTPTTVRIQDCVDTSLWLVYQASGGLVDDTPGGAHATAATVTNSSGTWMVSTLDMDGAGTC